MKPGAQGHSEGMCSWHANGTTHLGRSIGPLSLESFLTLGLGQEGKEP